jgi:hypothetical protein
LGTKLVEAETGYSVNEPVNYAVRAAIEQGVIEMVHEGQARELWKFKDNTYTGGMPAIRPMILEEALEKWPDARLNCSADNYCVPMEEESNQ